MNTSGSKVKCSECGDIIQSMHRHDFKWCLCNSVAVDGGNEYLKISCREDCSFEILKENK